MTRVSMLTVGAVALTVAATTGAAGQPDGTPPPLELDGFMGRLTAPIHSYIPQALTALPERVRAAGRAHEFAAGRSAPATANTDDIDARMQFVLQEVRPFQGRERGRRRIRNGALCSDSFGYLVLVGSDRDRRKFLRRHLEVNEATGWFKRAAPRTSGPITRRTSTPGLCTILVENIRWTTVVQEVGGGVQITHRRGNKKTRSHNLPAGCDDFFDRYSPSALYLGAFLNHLNTAWHDRNRRVVRRRRPPPPDRIVDAARLRAFELTSGPPQYRFNDNKTWLRCVGPGH